MIRTLTTWLLGLVLFLMAVTYKTHRDEAQDRKIEELKIQVLALRTELAEDRLMIRGGVQGKQFFEMKIITPHALQILEKLEVKK